MRFTFDRDFEQIDRVARRVAVCYSKRRGRSEDAYDNAALFLVATDFPDRLKFMTFEAMTSWLVKRALGSLLRQDEKERICSCSPDKLEETVESTDDQYCLKNEDDVKVADATIATFSERRQTIIKRWLKREKQNQIAKALGISAAGVSLALKEFRRRARVFRKEDMNENNFERMTLDQFRREYFPKTTRPSRAAVRRWTQSGTQEGVRLRACCIDGTIFIRRMDAEAFITSSAIASPSPEPLPSRTPSIQHEKAMAYLRSIKVVK